jgi:hypothetical protein
MSVYVLLFAAAALTASAQTSPEPAHQEKFFGKWMLDRAASKVRHAADLTAMEWRSYAADGEAVKVAWGKGPGEQGTYSARCDGSSEAANPGQIRCRQTDANTVEGEQLNDRDKTHRYYRRAVSADGRTLTITWYNDTKRSKPIDTFVFTRMY